MLANGNITNDDKFTTPRKFTNPHQSSALSGNLTPNECIDNNIFNGSSDSSINAGLISDMQLSGSTYSASTSTFDESVSSNICGELKEYTDQPETKGKDSGNADVQNVTEKDEDSAESVNSADSNSLLDEFLDRTSRLRIVGLQKKIQSQFTMLEHFKYVNQKQAEEKREQQLQLQLTEAKYRRTAVQLRQAKNAAAAAEQRRAAASEQTKLQLEKYRSLTAVEVNGDKLLVSVLG
ncbi:uncharacterized protein LOC125178157 [Hyalella azteca]|uniref:Uncharacterized protein LOC125178157 n=1 Tax=Hyalella azteca TaxID=294128 RepID=A0A979FM06_HYAAZ|nr:uncharacterized protein LOC125178157 [Hyalella azteca]